MRRITFFMPSLVGGGAERVTLDLCAGLAALGNDVELVLAHADGALAPREGETGVVPMVDLSRRRTVAALLPLARHLRRRRPEVLVAVLSHAGVIAALAHLLARSSARLVVMEHNTMSLNVRRSPRWRDRVVPLLCSIAYRRARLVCAVSRGVAEDLSRFPLMPQGRIQVVPNPIDYPRILELSRAEVPARLLPAPGSRLVVTAGRLVEQKDFGTLLRAMSRLPHDLHLVVLGEGPERPALEQLADELGLSARVVLAGYVENPYPVFRAADVFVLSSRWEGLPTVLLEVLAFDTAIVSTDCESGPREILDSGRHGELVPVGDTDALAAAITRSVEHPPTESRDDVRAGYTRDAVVRGFDHLVHGLDR